MRSDISEGGTFPNYELADQSGRRRSLSDLQGGNAMVLHLSRGGFDPKEHQSVRRLVDAYPEFRNAYTRIRSNLLKDGPQFRYTEGKSIGVKR